MPDKMTNAEGFSVFVLMMVGIIGAIGGLLGSVSAAIVFCGAVYALTHWYK